MPPLSKGRLAGLKAWAAKELGLSRAEAEKMAIAIARKGKLKKAKGAAQVGEIRKRSTGLYKKVAPKKWVKVQGTEGGKAFEKLSEKKAPSPAAKPSLKKLSKAPPPKADLKALKTKEPAVQKTLEKKGLAKPKKASDPIETPKVLQSFEASLAGKSDAEKAQAWKKKITTDFFSLSPDAMKVALKKAEHYEKGGKEEKIPPKPKSPPKTLLPSKDSPKLDEKDPIPTPSGLKAFEGDISKLSAADKAAEWNMKSLEAGLSSDEVKVAAKKYQHWSKKAKEESAAKKAQKKEAAANRDFTSDSGLPAIKGKDLKEAQSSVAELSGQVTTKGITNKLPVGSFEELSPPQQRVVGAIALYSNGNVDAVRNPKTYDEDLAYSAIDGAQLNNGKNVSFQGTREEYETAHRVMKGLAGAPSSGGPSVLRGMGLDDAIVEKLKQGKSKTFDLGPMSSFSTRYSIAHDFAVDNGGEGKTEVIFQMKKPKRGTDISKLSFYPQEAEFITSGKVRILGVAKESETAGITILDVEHL